jgi:hypothetical protein
MAATTLRRVVGRFDLGPLMSLEIKAIEVVE